MKDMKELFDKQPASQEAPMGLRNRVELASRQRRSAAWFNTKFRWAAAGTAVAAASIGFVMFMAPASAEAKTWDKVSAAYEQVKGMLIQMQFDDNDEIGSVTIAGKGNDWRVSMSGMGEDTVDISYSRGELMIWDGGDSAQIIDIGLNLPFSPDQVMSEIADELKVSKIFSQAAEDIGKENIRVEQPVMVNGRSVYNVYVNDPREGVRVHALVDAKTDLPISMEVDSGNGERFKMSFQFNGDFDASYLEPVLPTGIKFNRIDRGTLEQGHAGELFRGLEDMDFGFSGSEDADTVKSEVKVKTHVSN